MTRKNRVAAVAALVAGFLFPLFGLNAAEAPLPKIRDFDITTIEKLGQEIYAQDQLAWKATDVAFAKRGGARGLQRDGMKGWITESLDGKDVVRFIRVGSQGPEALYDVTYVQGSDPEFSTPDNRALSPEQVGQYNARMLALKNAGMPCGDRFNTVALKDTASEGWLVWALSASSDPDPIIMGGHFRFTITSAGNSIVSKDALSLSCRNFSKSAMAREAKLRKADVESAGLVMNHVVSLTPVETHVFDGLNYGIAFHVGTNDGKAWRIDKGHISNVEEDAPGIDGFSARMLLGVPEVCIAIASKLNETPKRYYPGKERTKVIEATEHADKFSIKMPPGFEAVGMVCSR